MLDRDRDGFVNDSDIVELYPHYRDSPFNITHIDMNGDNSLDYEEFFAAVCDP